MPKNRLEFEPKWFLVIIFFIAGIFLGGLSLYAYIFNGGEFLGVEKIHPAKGQYKFINPLLAVDSIEKKDFLEDKSLENKIRAVVEAKQKDGSISDAAVYFRDIEPGKWMGINEEARFSPGKLLKIPIMIAYYKMSEEDPSVLDKEIVLKAEPGFSQSPGSDLQIGKSYTVNELIKNMIVQDDDDASAVLFDNINLNSLNEVYSDLGINFPEDKINEDYISIKSYSLYFRVLYNATYLNRANSEKALQLLSQENPLTFSQTLGSVLPADIAVAQKYKMRMMPSHAGVYEGHDCGIVYYPNHPYLLCVMAMSKNSAAVSDLFREVSLTTYQDIDANYGNKN